MTASAQHRFPIWAEDDFNWVVGAVGYPEQGKTRKLMEVLAEAKRRYGCYTLIHDPSGNLKRRFYPYLIRHDTIESLEKGLREHPGGWHVSPYIDGEDTIECGWNLAGQCMEKGLPPVVVYIDECVFVDKMRSGAFPNDKRIRPIIMNRRHRNMGILWGCQSPKMIHYHIFAVSTHVFVFHMNSKKDIDWLVEGMMTPEVAEEVRELDQLEFVLWKPNHGVSESDDPFDDLEETRREGSK